MIKWVFATLLIGIKFFGFAEDFNVPPKIYDCFLFFNELEVLEIKLNELYDHVDHFVLVESAETFRGNPKPLYFNENKQQFNKFLDKIIHVIVDGHLETNDPWQREAYQRNQIMRGLSECQDSDIIIIEDLDEIVRASKLPEIITLLSENRSQFLTCNQTVYTYFLNRYGQWGGTVTEWLGSVAAKYADIKHTSPQEVRTKERNSNGAMQNAGWHFTYMGGMSRVKMKLESFSHAEFDNEESKSFQKIGEEIASLKRVEIDATYPQYVRDHIPYFKKLGLIDEGVVLQKPYNSITLLPFDPHGWYRNATVLEDFFKKYQPKVVIEVGCWLGLSTMHMASLLQQGGILYAVDHWLGSAENQPGQASWHPKLSVLYEQFLSNIIHSGLTDKVIPVRMNSLDASKSLAGLVADLIYIDASHDYDFVYSDVSAWYPFVKGHGILCGDDYLDGPGLTIKRAVDQFAAEHQLVVQNIGSFWYYQE